MDDLNENKIYDIMQSLLELIGGCHFQCDEHGMITNMSITADVNSPNWMYITGSSIDEFLSNLKYVNENGEEVELDLDEYEDDDFYQCVKYFLNSEIKSRSEQISISREDYLMVLCEDHFEPILLDTIAKKISGKNYKDFLDTELDASDVAKAATPSFINKYVEDLSIAIQNACTDLIEYSDNDIASINLSYLEEFSKRISASKAEEIIPPSFLDAFYESIKDSYIGKIKWSDVTDLKDVYNRLVAACSDYNYTLEEVDNALVETLACEYHFDEDELYYFSQKYPQHLNNNGVPYKSSDIANFVNDKNTLLNTMIRINDGLLGCHMLIDADGSIIDPQTCIDYSDINKAANFLPTSVYELLEDINYVNDQGEEVEFDTSKYDSQTFFQCLKYLLRDETAKRAEACVIPRDEYLSLLLSDNFENSLESAIDSSIKKRTDDGQSISDEILADDVIDIAAPNYAMVHKAYLEYKIDEAIDELDEYEGNEIAASNSEKLTELLTELQDATAEQIAPADLLKNVFGHRTLDIKFIDFVDENALHDYILSECDQYTYSLADVAKVLFNEKSDDYTLLFDINSQKEKLYDLVQKYPAKICKDGVPYEKDEVDSFVEVAVIAGWDSFLPDEKGNAK